MPTSKAAFERTIRGASGEASKISLFGALLAKDTRLGPNLYIVGGSAITIHTRGRYASADLDVVGDKPRIEAVLARWGFTPMDDEDGRVYWRRDDLGFAVDIIHRPVGLGSGNSGAPRTVRTAVGPVRTSAVEDLIIRRLMRWSRAGQRGLLDQAVLLYESNRDSLDVDYLESQVRYERVEAAYRELRRLSTNAASNGTLD
jgi:hypothetical protein